MNLNSIFFPAPKCSYTPQTLKNELIWIPKFKNGIFSFPEQHNTKIFGDYNVKTDHFASDINSLATNYYRSNTEAHNNSHKSKIFTKLFFYFML